MFNFLHTFVPNSIAFSIGNFAIHWYGLFVVSGIIAGLLIIIHLAKSKGIKPDEVFDLGFYVIIAGILGARIYSVLLDFPYYLANPGQIIAVWNGGLAIHGAIIGGAAALIYYVIKKRQSFWQWADLIVIGLPLGQTFGRWGNYFNQEIFGTPTTLPWGIPIELGFRPELFASFQYFHPTFLYESILNLINFFILLFIFKKAKVQTGTVAVIYLINYSVIRIAMEFLRTDNVPLLFSVRVTMVVSVVMLIVGIILLFKARKDDLTVV